MMRMDFPSLELAGSLTPPARAVVMPSPGGPELEERLEKQKLIPIVGQNFRNEIVELDGKSFRNCRFDNVTFVYRGIGRVELIKNEIDGDVVIKTPGILVSSVMTMLNEFVGLQSKRALVEHDVKGGWTYILIKKPEKQ